MTKIICAAPRREDMRKRGCTAPRLHPRIEFEIEELGEDPEEVVIIATQLGMRDFLACALKMESRKALS